MESSKTLNQVAKDILGTQISEAIDQLEVATSNVVHREPTNPTDFYTVDDLMRKYLVGKAVSKVDAKAGEFGIALEVEKFRLAIGGKGSLLLLILLALITLILGTLEPLTVIQTLFR